jgi:hypothetical protein
VVLDRLGEQGRVDWERPSVATMSVRQAWGPRWPIDRGKPESKLQLVCDDPRVGRLLEQLLAHQDPSGRFPSFGASRAGAAPVWGALPCDSHAVI